MTSSLSLPLHRSLIMALICAELSIACSVRALPISLREYVILVRGKAKFKMPSLLFECMAATFACVGAIPIDPMSWLDEICHLFQGCPVILDSIAALIPNDNRFQDIWPTVPKSPGHGSA